ncbi:MAG: Uncharacterized protein XD78_1631 [Desulfotomaculum sp. 46_296]|nr:MAG: Uncharacterized protein XD78_1631 [Desulfotomaculum sp. 46_296]
MIRLSLLNSRMKDFYDIYNLSKSKDFEGRVLQEAISQTFQRRKTTIEREQPIFQDPFINSAEKQREWSNYIRRIRVSSPEYFKDVMNQIILFLKPIYDSLCNEEEFSASIYFPGAAAPELPGPQLRPSQRVCAAAGAFPLRAGHCYPLPPGGKLTRQFDQAWPACRRRAKPGGRSRCRSGCRRLQSQALMLPAGTKRTGGGLRTRKTGQGAGKG